MKIEDFTLGEVKFQKRRADKGEKPLQSLFFYEECPLDCIGCGAPHYTKQQTELALSAREHSKNPPLQEAYSSFVPFFEGKQNEEAVKCPYNIAQNYV